MDDARTTAASVIDGVSEEDAREGARNLLVNAAGVGEGTDFLIINDSSGHIDPEVTRIVADEARRLGARVHVLWSDPTNDVSDISPAVQAAFETADVTLFHHRMSSQMRMLDIKGGCLVSNFATTLKLLASPMARMDPAYWHALLVRLQQRLNRAERWRVTCPDGTDIAGRVAPKPAAKTKRPEGQTFSTVSFPPGVFTPFPTDNAAGVLGVRWLIGSGIHFGGKTTAALSGTVLVSVEDGKFTGYEGDPAAVAELKDFLGDLGGRYDKDPFMINGWHAGMNAVCASDRTMDEDLDHWMFVAHSHPRVVHFHAVGSVAPGEVSITTLDPTITIDDEVLWEDGRLVFADGAEVRGALAPFGDPDVASRLTPIVF